MLRILRQPRWLAFAAFAVVLALGCARLGLWQLARLEDRQAARALLEGNLAAPPAPVDDVLVPGRAPDPGQEWRRVTARGRYDAAGQVLVRNRSLEGAGGSYVLVPLRTDDGAAVLVNRGWIPRTPRASERVDVPPAPTGDVQVLARVRVGESVSDDAALGRAELPQPSVGRLDPLRIASSSAAGPVYGGYVELVEERPAPPLAPRLMPVPDIGAGPHLAYGMQWFLFAVFTLGGFVVLLRRELREAVAARARRA